MSKVTLYASFLITGYAVVATACSAETMKRTGYETLQNIRAQECSRTPSVECEKREQLEVYEDKRQDTK